MMRRTNEHNVFFFVKHFMTTVFPVQPGGWQPVSSEDKITIGSTSELTMKQYVIHFGSDTTDYYAFFGSDSIPLAVSLVETTLTVTGTISYIQRVEEDTTKGKTYNAVEYKLMFDNDITGGLQLVQRFIVESSYSGKPFGKTMLSDSVYDNNKYAYIAGTGIIVIDEEKYEQFFKKSFTITPLPDFTQSITPSENTLYITISTSDFTTNQNVMFDNSLPQNFAIGGSTGITVSGFTQTAASGTDNHLVIQIVNNSEAGPQHGRTAPIIKFVDGTTTVSVSIPSQLTGFVEPVNVVKSIIYRFLANKSGIDGMVELDQTNLANITFDTSSKLTIPEVSGEYVLTAPSVVGQLFQLNKETVEAPNEGVYYISFATIDKSTPAALKLAPLTATLNDTKYEITSNDAVYIVRFKLGVAKAGRYPASTQVVGKVAASSINTFDKVPLELTLLGDNSKHQLPYINVINNSIALQTVDHAYALPYDTNVFRSSDLKAAGIIEFPSNISTNNMIFVEHISNITIEFNKETEDMFKSIITINIVYNKLIIYNWLNWSQMKFETDDALINITSSASNTITVYNVDDGFLNNDYINYNHGILIGYCIEILIFENIASTWTQFTMSDAPFSLSSDTQFTDSSGSNPITIKPTTNVIKFTDGSITRYFVIYDEYNSYIVNMSNITTNTATIKLPQFSWGDIYLYELIQTHTGKSYNYKYIPTGIIISNIQQFANKYIGNIGLSNTQEIFSYLDKYVFTSNKIGRVNKYNILPSSITNETDIPNYILTQLDTKQRDDIQSFDLMWCLNDNNISTLTIQGFTPTSSHTIESSKDMTITLNNEVDWTKTNQLILKGGTWIVNNKSNSEIGSIINNDVSAITSVSGWENKYLSQIGANSSIQKNLQTIYDALGQTVNRVSVGDEIQYAINVNNFSNDLFQELIDRISNAMQVSVSSGENRISDYVVKLGESSTDIKPIQVVFNIPSKDGSTTKEITAEVSLNLLTSDGDLSTEHDYYKMFYNTVEKTVIFSKDEGSSQLDSALFDGVAIKRVGQTPKLFFNNSVLVITTPLFAEDFDNELPDTITEQFISPTSNGRLVYKLVGISNLILVDTVNKSGVVITDGFE